MVAGGPQTLDANTGAAARTTDLRRGQATRPSLFTYARSEVEGLDFSESIEGARGFPIGANGFGKMGVSI
jgi:hypothetical protein